MAKKTGGFLVLAALILVAAVLAGCGPKPPCEGATVTQVMTAQDECDAASAELEAARMERAELEADLTETKAEIAKLEGKPDDLAAYLEELKKGSGR